MHTLQRQGRTLHVDDRQPTFWSKFAAGTWEPETLALLDRLLMPETTFLDIGAWVGPTALWAAFTARRVLALEADPEALQQFHGNLAANPRLARRIEVIGKALHPTPGTVVMGARRKPGDSMSSLLLAHGADRHTPVWRTEAITPTNLAARIAPQEDLVLKLDIEGGEYALLPAMAPLLQRTRAALISFHPALAQSAAGWSAERARRYEADFFDSIPEFATERVSGDDDSSTREWLLNRNGTVSGPGPSRSKT